MQKVFTKNFCKKFLQKTFAKSFYKKLLQKVFTKKLLQKVFTKKLLQKVFTKNFCKKFLQKKTFAKSFYKKISCAHTFFCRESRFRTVFGHFWPFLAILGPPFFRQKCNKQGKTREKKAFFPRKMQIIRKKIYLIKKIKYTRPYKKRDFRRFIDYWLMTFVNQ